MVEAEEQFVVAPHPPGAAYRAVGYRTAVELPREHRGLPSPFLTFSVSLDQPVRVDGTVEGGPSEPAELDVLLAGLHLEPTTVRLHPVETGVQAAVRPLAARVLFGVPARELRGRSLHGEEVLGAARAAAARAARRGRRLGGAAPPPRRRDRQLGRRRRSRPQPPARGGRRPAPPGSDPRPLPRRPPRRPRPPQPPPPLRPLRGRARRLAEAGTAALLATAA